METHTNYQTEQVLQQTKDNVVNLVLEAVDKRKQVLIFNNSKSSSELTAEKVANSIRDVDKENYLQKLSKQILETLSIPTKQCIRLSKCVEKGVAFHHSGLTAKQRSLIEKAFKEGYIKVISSTPTLAAGLNLPAYKVIIKDYKRYSSRGFNDIPILEFHQMAGRAGRPGIEDEGRAVLHVKSEDELERVVPKYIFGEPEEIISKLAVEPVLKMYTLSLISMNIINTKKEIEEFFSNTLYGQQFEDLEGLKYNIFRILNILIDYNFVNREDDYYMATSLGKKVSELYLNPDTANYFIENQNKLEKLFSKEKLLKSDLFSFVHFLTNTMEMKPLFRIYKKEEENYLLKLEDVGESLLVEFDPFESDYTEFASTLKTTDILVDWTYEAHEEYISTKYNVTPGELNYKLEVVDWLLYCLEEIALLRKNFYLRNKFNRLRQRFKMGVRDELLPLVSLKGIGRVRARKLYNADFKSILDLKLSSIDSISKIVGDTMAVNIKRQVSDEAILEKHSLKGKPKEIKVREVSDEEVDILVSNYNQFEKEKEERNKSLKDFF